MSESVVPEISQAERARFEPIVKSLGPSRAALANQADVVNVRPGYDYADPGSPVPAVVVAFEAVRAAVTPAGRRLELVLHPIPAKPAGSGVKAHDLDEEESVIAPLEKKMGDRFQMSWATLVSKTHPDGQWASAYHIKVAVRDGKTFWLSSGNWQSSNQPDVKPFDDPPGPLPPSFQRKYNRDYHAIIENDALSAAYETYIKRDYELTATAAAPESFALPDLFVPAEEEEEAVEFAEPPQFFKPLRLERKLKVQPLLTPVYEYDWQRLATAKPTPPRVRVARTGEKTPRGFKRVPFSAVVDD